MFSIKCPKTFFIHRKIQSVFEMSDGSGLAVTVARYETPDHIDINKVLYLSTSLHSQRLLISLVNLVFERPGIFDPFAYMNESVWICIIVNDPNGQILRTLDKHVLVGQLGPSHSTCTKITHLTLYKPVILCLP